MSPSIRAVSRATRRASPQSRSEPSASIASTRLKPMPSASSSAATGSCPKACSAAGIVLHHQRQPGRSGDRIPHAAQRAQVPRPRYPSSPHRLAQSPAPQAGVDGDGLDLETLHLEGFSPARRDIPRAPSARAANAPAIRRNAANRWRTSSDSRKARRCLRLPQPPLAAGSRWPARAYYAAAPAAFVDAARRR